MDVKECVGCGYCCIKTPCAAALRLYPGTKQCPQLLWLDGRYECGLMKISDPIGAEYRRELYAGSGCCCGMNSWRQDVKQRFPELNYSNLNPLPKLMQMFIISLAGEFISSDSIYLALSSMKGQMEKDDYAPEEIESIMQNIVHLFGSGRSTMTKSFMG